MSTLTSASTAEEIRRIYGNPVSRGRRWHLTQKDNNSSQTVSPCRDGTLTQITNGALFVSRSPKPLRSYNSHFKHLVKLGMPPTATRLQRRLFELEHGIGMRNQTRTAVEMAKEFGLSLETAFRHLRHGTTPAKDRRVGHDGKTYPAHKEVTDT